MQNRTEHCNKYTYANLGGYCESDIYNNKELRMFYIRSNVWKCY